MFSEKGGIENAEHCFAALLSRLQRFPGQNSTDTKFDGGIGPLWRCSLNQIVQGGPKSPSNWVYCAW